MSNLLNILPSEILAGDQMTNLSLWVLLLPFASFLFLIFLGRVINKYRGIFATTVMLVCSVMALVIFIKTWGGAVHEFRIDWFSLGPNFKFYFGLRVDRLAALLILMVTFVSFLVHLFSIEYLRGERNFEKYFSYLGLFTFSMLGIVLSDNLLSIFIFWELVGLSSYLLIGFYYQSEAAVYANKKAFVVNRIGDAGFLVGILILYAHYGTLNLQQLATTFADSSVGELTPTMLTIAGLGLFCGAVGKSAQFPLQVWLPNAMEGPTPVSALIHAATMVAAGVYLLARVYVFMSLDALTVITIIGTITAFMGAFAALSQNDIKKVLAFSTISQLGYMVMGMGLGAYDASLFHLMTHAFFKACLFLSAGAVIHSMHHLEHELHKEGHDIHFDHQDMRLMGGLRKKMPVTFIAFTVAAMSLAGLPLFSGFLSKDAILASAIAWGVAKGGVAFIVPIVGFLAAFMTAFYMGRQILLVFFGEFRLDKFYPSIKGGFNRVIETPWLMRIPIIVLAILSVGFVFSINPIDGAHGWFLSSVKIPQTVTGIEDVSKLGLAISAGAHHFHYTTVLISMTLAIAGLLLAYVLFNPAKPIQTQLLREKIITTDSFLHRLSINNWMLDGVYDLLFVKSTVGVAHGLHWVDKNIIDGFVNVFGRTHVVVAHVVGWMDKAIVDGLVNLLAYLAKSLGGLFRSGQNGKVQAYIGFTVICVITGLLIWIIRR